MATVGVAIPAIPNRPHLSRAVASVMRQTRPVDQISVAVDTGHEGAWATRNRALAALSTDWVAFLDDDDELLPLHVEHLLEVADEHDAGMVWGWFTVDGGTDPFPPEFRGKQYEAPDGHCVPITYMVRRSILNAAIQQCGGFQPDPDATGNWGVQDLPLIDAIHEVLDIRRAAAANWPEKNMRWTRSYASPQTTWCWYHWGYGTVGQPGNTSGLPGRW